MGACMSGVSEAGALKASKDLDKLINQAYVFESDKIKLLLLGAGESGKSTIFKQMRLLFGAPLTEAEKNQITPVVYSNTISSMKALVQAVSDFGYEDEVSKDCANFAQIFKRVRNELTLNSPFPSSTKTTRF
jgi:hypothetical protein